MAVSLSSGIGTCYVCIVQLNEAPPTPHLASALFQVMHQIKQAQHDDPVDRSAIIILAHLKQHGTLRLSDLAGHLCLDVSTVSRQARTLEERGYVSRAEDPADGRAVRLTLAEPGLAVLDTALRNRQAWLDRSLADWSEAERHDLAVTLDKLAVALAEGQTDQ
jgi:DNA-binding MarR family transcriptional regulator